MNARRWMIASVTALMAISISVPAAHAGHGGAGSGHPDNTSQAVSMQDLTWLGQQATSWAKDQLERSELTMSWGGGDIYVYDGSFTSSSAYGWTSCTSTNWWNGWCDTYSVTYNQAMLGYANQWRSVGCHEFGHTAHLGHRTSATDTDNNSCMRSMYWNEYFDAHDINAIDALSY